MDAGFAGHRRLQREPAVSGAAVPGKWWKWLAISAVVVALDQISKAVIQRSFTPSETLPITAFFNLVLAYNTGAAFSFLADAGGWQRGFFIGMSAVISIFLLVVMRRHPENRLLCTAVGLILGGAVGNLYDRVALGQVVDFIQVHAAGHYFPAFNVADSAITIGAILLIADSFRKPAVKNAAESPH